MADYSWGGTGDRGGPFGKQRGITEQPGGVGPVQTPGSDPDTAVFPGGPLCALPLRPLQRFETGGWVLFWVA